MSDKVIDNKWIVLEELGGGGQATVYKVCSKSNAKDIYALKYLKSQNNEERRKRLIFEVKNLQKLKNPHISCVVDSNVDSSDIHAKLYYVCQFITGENLETFVRQKGCSFTEAIAFATDLLNTIHYYQQEGIVHRDIKPDNIMIEDNNIMNYTLIDFGLSYDKDIPQEKLTELGQQLGNRFLHLPELEGDDENAKRLYQSDLTQWAGVFFYVLSGKPPITLRDEKGYPPHRREAIQQILADKAPNSTVKENLNAFFDKAFQHIISDRYQSVDSIITDLNTLEISKVNTFGEGNSALDKGMSYSLVRMSYGELLRDLNPGTEICNPSGLTLPATTDVVQLMDISVALSEKDRNKIARYYQQYDYSTAAEIIWPRAINKLRLRILSLGEEFVADMVETKDMSYVQNLPAYKVICLANDLGFIDHAGRFNLLKANEYYNYFLEGNAEEEMPQDEANIIIKTSVRYILYNNDDKFGFKFNDFREKLKSIRITDLYTDTDYMFQTSPYFYLKTTVRSLLNLFVETDGIEFENVTANLALVIPNIWPRLKTEEKIALADAYTDCVNSNDYSRTAVLNNVLMKVQGFDYVKENIRSRTFIQVANKLVDIHFGANNFYNEPNAIKTLRSLGTKFPHPALKNCITAVLFVKLGNSYGISWDAQDCADELLDRLTEEEWVLYIDRYLKEERLLTDSLFGHNKSQEMYSRWKALVQKYHLNEYNYSDSDVKKYLR